MADAAVNTESVSVSCSVAVQSDVVEIPDSGTNYQSVAVRLSFNWADDASSIPIHPLSETLMLCGPKVSRNRFRAFSNVLTLNGSDEMMYLFHQILPHSDTLLGPVVMVNPVRMD